MNRYLKDPIILIASALFVCVFVMSAQSGLFSPLTNVFKRLARSPAPGPTVRPAPLPLVHGGDPRAGGPMLVEAPSGDPPVAGSINLPNGQKVVYYGSVFGNGTSPTGAGQPSGFTLETMPLVRKTTGKIRVGTGPEYDTADLGRALNEVREAEEIDLAPETFTLSGRQPYFSKHVHIVGSGARTVVVGEIAVSHSTVALESLVLDGGGYSSILSGANGSLTLKNVTLRNGHSGIYGNRLHISGDEVHFEGLRSLCVELAGGSLLLTHASLSDCRRGIIARSADSVEVEDTNFNGMEDAISVQGSGKAPTCTRCAFNGVRRVSDPRFPLELR